LKKSILHRNYVYPAITRSTWRERATIRPLSASLG